MSYVQVHDLNLGIVIINTDHIVQIVQHTSPQQLGAVAMIETSSTIRNRVEIDQADYDKLRLKLTVL